MGWLRDAWDSRGVHSPNDCAARMLRSAAWPPEITYKKLYLGNRIRALERGEGAHWWLRDERRQIVVALAEVLEWQVDVLRGAITGEQPLAGATPLVASGRTPLAGLGRIRPLHLDSEALPPGVPETVVHPARWRRHWWYSADHATLELAARWLSRRRRAHVVHASSLREAAPRVPARGRVFILLRTWKRGDDPRAYFTAPEFSELRVCVAAPFPHDAVEPVAVPGQMLEWRRDHPDEQSQAPVTTWESLGTHPLDAFGEVADWAADRLPQHRRGVIGRAREAVSASGLGAFITGPVDALEFIGLVHYLDGRHPLPRTIADWVRAFHEALHGSQEAGITVDVLRTAVGILEQRETTPLAFGLTEKEWSRGFADALEGRHATPSGGREFEQLAERGLLVERSRGRWVLGPAIFRRLLSADAFQGIFTDDEHQLGLLLSRPHIAARVVDRLIERYRVQLPPAIEGKREVHRQRLNDPIAMMGFEARLRAFGLAVLLRKDAPKDLVEHAVEAFHRLFLLPAATRLPYPLLGLESATDTPDLAHDGLLYLAYAALVERSQHPDGCARLHAWLDLDGERPRFPLHAQLDAAIEGLKTASSAAVLVPAAMALGVRLVLSPAASALRRYVGSEYLAPGVFIRYMREYTDEEVEQHEDRFRPLLRSITRLRDPLLFLQTVLAALPIGDITDHDAVHWLFFRYMKWPETIEDWPPYAWLRSAPEAARLLWERAPYSAIEMLVQRSSARREHTDPIVVQAVLERSWISFVATWLWWFAYHQRLRSDRASFVVYWEQATKEQLVRALSVSGWSELEPAPEVFAVYWRRAPREAAESLRRLSARAMLDWIDAAPDHHTELALEVLTRAVNRAWLERHPGALERVTMWLQSRVRRRAGPWRRCYKLLIELHRSAIERSLFDL